MIKLNVRIVSHVEIMNLLSWWNEKQNHLYRFPPPKKKKLLTASLTMKKTSEKQKNEYLSSILQNSQGHEKQAYKGLTGQRRLRRYDDYMWYYRSEQKNDISGNWWSMNVCNLDNSNAPMLIY